jgi:hypothetical protein
MITEQLINDADEKFRSFCVEKKGLRVSVYILLGISSLLGLMSIYFYFCDNFNLYKRVKS